MSETRDMAARLPLMEAEIEKGFQDVVVRAAILFGWLVYHTHDSRRSEPGFPDLVLVHPGRGLVLFRELKRERGRLSAAQRVWLESLREAGADADVWRPRDWPEIERLLRGSA